MNQNNKKIGSEIEMLNKLAEEPDGIRLLESYKNDMQLQRDWNGITGLGCLHIMQHLERLIGKKKKLISLSNLF